jgi:hypothetical protein
MPSSITRLSDPDNFPNDLVSIISSPSQNFDQLKRIKITATTSTVMVLSGVECLVL